jgi:ABC-type transporter Mla subunit MlaD
LFFEILFNLKKKDMETFYIFSFGILFSLIVACVIYSVIVISKLKKDRDDLFDELENLQRDISSIEGLVEAEQININELVTEKVNLFNTTLNEIMNTIETKIREIDNELDNKQNKK